MKTKLVHMEGHITGFREVLGLNRGPNICKLRGFLWPFSGPSVEFWHCISNWVGFIPDTQDVIAW
jgi:hypothetical protein